MMFIYTGIHFPQTDGNEQLLNKEMEYLRNIFRHTYGYPKAVIQNTNSKIKESFW